MGEWYEFAGFDPDKITLGWSALIHSNSIALVISERFWEHQRESGTLEQAIDALAWAVRDGMRRQLMKEKA